MLPFGLSEESCFKLIFGGLISPSLASWPRGAQLASGSDVTRLVGCSLPGRRNLVGFG